VGLLFAAMEPLGASSACQGRAPLMRVTAPAGAAALAMLGGPIAQDAAPSANCSIELQVEVCSALGNNAGRPQLSCPHCNGATVIIAGSSGAESSDGPGSNPLKCPRGIVWLISTRPCHSRDDKVGEHTVLEELFTAAQCHGKVQFMERPPFA